MKYSLIITRNQNQTRQKSEFIWTAHNAGNYFEILCWGRIVRMS